jgi:cytochrome P450
MDDQGDKSRYLVEGQPTIFHELINSNLPPREKTLDRLWQEGQVVVGAGADTTANTLTVITFHLLDNPEKLVKLKKELATVLPTPTSRPKLLELEKLPYFVRLTLKWRDYWR